jgi:ribonuclease J
MGFLRKRLDEVHLTSSARLHVVEFNTPFRVGCSEVEFLRVSHSIPDAAAIVLRTPLGTIVHSGDFKFDLTPVNEPPADFARLSAVGDRGVLAFLCESTNALKPGHVMSECAIGETVRDLIRDANGRVIVSTFSSLLNRIAQILVSAQELGRKVYVSGRSMEENISIAEQLGYLRIPRGLVRRLSQGIDKLSDREVLILTTGAQGEEMAGLARIGLGTHQQVAVKPGDTVILSSNPIIGNERAIATVINNLHLKGARVVTSATLDLHTTGHAHQKDLLLMHRLIRAKHVIPCHGEPYMRSAHAELLKSIGYEDQTVHLLSNGEVLEFERGGGARKSKQRVSALDVIIDGRGASSEGERVLADRKQLSSSGMLVVVLKAYSNSHRLASGPDVITRGLFYGSERLEIQAEVARTARLAYEEALGRGGAERADLKKRVIEAVHRYFRRKLNREPMIVPIIVEV